MTTTTTTMMIGRKYWALCWLHLFLWTPCTVQGWHSCDGGGVCPEGNTCCSTTTTTTTAESFLADSQTVVCISGHNASTGSCCEPFNGRPTGCGEGFACARDPSNGLSYCQRVNASDTSLPDQVPRYRLCSLPDDVYQQVYGLPISDDVDDDAESPQLAYMSSMGALDSSDPVDLSNHQRVQTLVIMIHGSGRNADDYLATTNCALPVSQQDPSTSSIMIVTPWFLAPDDGPVEFYHKNTTTEPIRWSDSGPIWHTWRYGADAINGHNFSSYDAVDVLIDRIYQDPLRFPHLQHIVVAGHSAGGQYTQRWALLSNNPIFDAMTTSIPPQHQEMHHYQRRQRRYQSVSPEEFSRPSPVSIRIVVANPKSFCFLDNRRYFRDVFRKPHKLEIGDCTTYNEWEWGLDNTTNYLPTPYKDRAIVMAGGVDAVVQRYATRNVIYLAGELDVLPNGDCQAKLQGPYRRKRSEHFFASLSEIYGHGQHVHHRFVVKGVYHNHGLMFQSPEGYLAMFGSIGDPM